MTLYLVYWLMAVHFIADIEAIQISLMPNSGTDPDALKRLDVIKNRNKTTLSIGHKTVETSGNRTKLDRMPPFILPFRRRKDLLSQSDQAWPEVNPPKNIQDASGSNPDVRRRRSVLPFLTKGQLSRRQTRSDHVRQYRHRKIPRRSRYNVDKRSTDPEWYIYDE